MGIGTVKVPVSGIFIFSGGIGTGIVKILYRKKSRNRYRKNLVPKKVPVSVSFEILGTVTHCHIQIQFHFQQLRLHKTSLATVFYGSNKLWSKCTGRTKHKSRTKYLQTSHLLPLNGNHSNNGIPHIFLEVIFCREGRLRRGELQRAKMQRVSNSSKSNFFAQLSVLKNWNTRSKKLQFLQPIFKVFVGQSVQGSRCDKHWSCFASNMSIQCFAWR